MEARSQRSVFGKQRAFFSMCQKSIYLVNCAKDPDLRIKLFWDTILFRLSFFALTKEPRSN